MLKCHISAPRYEISLSLINYTDKHMGMHTGEKPLYYRFCYKALFGRVKLLDTLNPHSAKYYGETKSMQIELY